MSTTGKLDKKALPPFDRNHSDDVQAEGRPSTAMEENLAAIWREVLRIQDIDIHESFFDMGGYGRADCVCLKLNKAFVDTSLLFYLCLILGLLL